MRTEAKMVVKNKKGEGGKEEGGPMAQHGKGRVMKNNTRPAGICNSMCTEGARPEK